MDKGEERETRKEGCRRMRIEERREEDIGERRRGNRKWMDEQG